MQPTLGHVFAGLSSYEIRGDEPLISAVVVDSREAVPHSLFVALHGEQVDGHDYVADAFSRGAIAALIERPLDLPVAQIDLTTGDDIAEIAAWSGNLPVCILVENSILALQEAAKAVARQIRP